MAPPFLAAVYSSRCINSELFEANIEGVPQVRLRGNSGIVRRLYYGRIFIGSTQLVSPL